MTQLDTLLSLAKENKLRIFKDVKGNIVLREPSSLRFQGLKDIYPKTLTDTQYCPYSQLLHPEMRITRLPLAKWSKLEISQLQHYTCLDDIYSSLPQLVISFNQIPLVLTFYGYTEEAKFLCEKSILFFAQLAEISGQKNLLGYTIQPWINLGRLDRIFGQHEETLEKFRLLNSSATEDTQKSIYADIVKKALHNPQHHLDEQLTVAKFCSILEPLKTLLLTQAFWNILNFEASKQSDISEPTVSLHAEAKIIALIKLGQYQDALNIALQSYDECTPLTLPVFLFRIIELSYLLGDQETAKKEAHNLYKNMMSRLSKDLNHYELALSIELSLLLHHIGLPIEALQLANLCLASYKSLDDELAIINSLSRIIYILGNDKRKGMYQEELKQKIQESDYIMIKRKFCIKDRNHESTRDQLMFEFSRVMKLVLPTL